VCLELRLIIELDGSQHVDQKDYDNKRSSWLEIKGFKVIRFWNNDLTENVEGVLRVIEKQLLLSRPRP
jgi:very-short-patch-repair endonuclease